MRQLVPVGCAVRPPDRDDARAGRTRAPAAGLDRLCAPRRSPCCPHRRRLRAALALRRLPAPGPLRAAEADRAAVELARVAAGAPARARARASRCSPAACRASSSATSTRRPPASLRPRATTSTSRARRAAAARCTPTPGASSRASRGASASSGRAGGLRPSRHQRRRLRLAPQGPQVANVVDVSSCSPSRRRQRHPLPIAIASRTPAICATPSGSPPPRACSTASPGSSGASRRSRTSAAAAPASTTWWSRRRPPSLGDRKAAAILETGAETYASANPGCLVQVSRRCAGPATRCRRFTRSSSSTPRYVAWRKLASCDPGLIDHFLGDPEPALSIDLHTLDESALPREITITRTIVNAGRLDGYAVFFRARVDHDLTLSSSPLDPNRAPHWGFRILRTDRDDFCVGDTIDVRLAVGSWADPDSWRWSHVKRSHIESGLAGLRP